MSHPVVNLNDAFSIVDVEASGEKNGHIIEIGVVKIRNRKIVETYQSLVKPPVLISEFIQSLTGITNDGLERAPTFGDILEPVKSILSDSAFVAHNVNFDYLHLKSEFERLGEPFYMDRYCTVNIIRKLFPGHKKFNLDVMSEHFGVNVEKRHRAMDDAMAVAQIFLKLIEVPEATNVFSMYAKSFNTKDKWYEKFLSKIEHLPKGTGVYLFKDEYNLPLYIGKSMTIKSRVLSHLRDHDIPKKHRLLRSTDHFDFVLCDSELEAEILESKLIKKHQPPYNEKLVHRKDQFYIKITTEKYPRIFRTSKKDNMGAHYLGPYRSSQMIDHLIEKVRNDLRLCPELINSNKKSKAFCFSYHVKKCVGPCGEAITSEAYQSLVLKAIVIFEKSMDLDDSESIGKFLKSTDARDPKLNRVRTSLRSLKQKMDENPEFFGDNFVALYREESTAFWIQRGLLQKSFTGITKFELSGLRFDDARLREENAESLDERLTIRRYLHANQSKLEIFKLDS